MVLKNAAWREISLFFYLTKRQEMLTTGAIHFFVEHNRLFLYGMLLLGTYFLVTGVFIEKL
jgi:hypothetical protein